MCEIATFDCDCEINEFAAALELFIKRPHLIDKRLSGSKLEGKAETSSDEKIANLNFSPIENDSELIPKSSDVCSIAIKRKLLVKKGQKTSFDFVIWTRKSENEAKVSVEFENPSQNYNLEIVANSKIELRCQKNSPILWLKKVFVKKLLQWASEKIEAGASGTSLKLVNLDEYVQLYNELKKRHFENILSQWNSESTNAEKFIHEDLGIATYLLLIWREQRPKSFVDLGCGNGLLVYLLHKEGIPGGVGLDIRKRKIWNFFREEGADLR